MAYRTCAFRCLFAVTLSIMNISTTVALSVNPTNRYMKEMGRLLRDPQLQVVASPAKAPTETEPVLRLEEEEVDTQFEDIDWPQNQPSSPFSRFDEPAFNMFDEPKRFETPRPPSDPYYQKQRELFDGYYPQPPEEESRKQTDRLEFTQPPNEQFYPRQTNSQPPIEPYHQPRRGRELFDAFNEHIEALDQEFQISNSLRNVVDENFPQPELEWEYDEQDRYYEDEGYSSPQSEFGSVEANGSFQESASQSATNFFEATEQFQSHEQTPEQQQSEQENHAWRQEMERLASERAEQELREELLERQRLEQERNTSTREEEAYFERLKQEKVALERESARRKAEEENRIFESKHQQPAFIIKSRLAPLLPKTNDPFELLGLDYQNPPENAHDIRRAFLKMAKKYHPDAVATDATPEEREKASHSFARINSAYQLLKDKQERLGDEYFATMSGGAMYTPRNSNSHVRQSFSRGYGFDDYGSIFSGNCYSATYGAKHRGYKPESQNWDSRNPFRRNRQEEAGDNCHVSGKEFPPFFNN